MSSLNSISAFKKNRVYAPIITGLAIIILVFLARPGFASYNESKLLLTQAEQTLTTEQDKLKKLQENAAMIGGDNEKAKQIQKISKDFNASEIMETIMINHFTTVNSVGSATSPFINISNLSIDQGSKEANGLHRGTVTMAISSDSYVHIANFLDYLTTSSAFAFSLSDINLPVNTGITSPSNSQNTETSVSVTLGLYYYP